MGDGNVKRHWTFWWIGNLFWMVLFMVGTAFVWLRDVDGAGVTQTPELKLISFLVLLVAFIFPFIIQMVWLIIILMVNNKKTNVQQ